MLNDQILNEFEVILILFSLVNSAIGNYRLISVGSNNDTQISAYRSGDFLIPLKVFYLTNIIICIIYYFTYKILIWQHKGFIYLISKHKNIA